MNTLEEINNRLVELEKEIESAKQQVQICVDRNLFAIAQIQLDGIHNRQVEKYKLINQLNQIN